MDSYYRSSYLLFDCIFMVYSNRRLSLGHKSILKNYFYK